MNSGLTLDSESRALVKALPPETTDYIEPETLSHFDFLGQCKPGGLELLAREEPGDEIICMSSPLVKEVRCRWFVPIRNRTAAPRQPYGMEEPPPSALFDAPPPNGDLSAPTPTATASSCHGPGS